MENKYRIGTFIKIQLMIGEDHYTGKTGYISHIDGQGQLHGTWGGLALQPDKDKIEIVKDFQQMLFDYFIE